VASRARTAVVLIENIQCTSAIVRVAWTPVRREPRHASEMVSQVLLGEVLESADSTDGHGSHPDWAAIRGLDGYEGFVTRGSLLECTGPAALDWNSRADSTSLGTGLDTVGKECVGGCQTPGHAPWGAKLASAGDGLLELPGGCRVNPTVPSRIIAEADRATLYARDPAKLVKTSELWLGAPYLWGGRTLSGVDCSGFVQSVFSLHGFQLARDSLDQFKAGSRVTQSQPGDLWFFAFDGGPVSHVGICMGDTRMIHASETRGCVALDDVGDGDSGDYGRLLAEGFVGAVRLGG